MANPALPCSCISNIGNESLETVLFSDQIFIPTQLAIGMITVDPLDLNVGYVYPWYCCNKR